MVLTGQLSGMICFTVSSKYSLGVVAHEFHFVKLAFGGDGICELCGVEEMERTHFFILCPVINNIYNHFSPLLYTISPDMME